MLKIYTYSLGELSQIVQNISPEDRIIQIDNASQYGWINSRHSEDLSLYFDDTTPHQYQWGDRFKFWIKGGKSSDKQIWNEHYMLVWQKKAIANKLLQWKAEQRTIHVACEYGKSRSVAIAQAAKIYLGYVYENERQGNLWIQENIVQTLMTGALTV